MSEDPYRRLAQAGLAPLVEDVPPGPEWEELTPPTPTASAIRRRPGAWVMGLGSAAVVLIIVIGVAAVFLRGEPTPSTPSNVSSDLSTVFEAPILDQPTNSFVYLTTDKSLTVVDVDSATATVQQVPELAPGDPPYDLIRRGEVLVFYGRTEVGPAAYALDPSVPTAPVLIGEAWFFVPSATEDRVWLAILDESSPDTVRALKSVREVTVDGTVTTGDVPPPDGRWPVAAIDDGLIFQGDQFLEVWDPESQTFVETLPGPFPVAPWHNRLVTCSPQCDELHLIDLDGDTQRSVNVPEGMASVNGYGGAFSPDGRYVAVQGFDTLGTLKPETGVAVVLIDFESGTAAVVPGTSHGLNPYPYPQVAWSSDGEWLFFSVGALNAGTGQLFAYHPGDGTAYRVPVVLDGQYYGMAGS